MQGRGIVSWSRIWTGRLGPQLLEPVDVGGVVDLAGEQPMAAAVAGQEHQRDAFGSELTYDENVRRGAKRGVQHHLANILQPGQFIQTGAADHPNPYGNAESPFDICELVKGAGASFVARWTTYHPRQIVKTAKKAIQKKGFAFVEVLSQCPA